MTSDDEKLVDDIAIGSYSLEEHNLVMERIWGKLLEADSNCRHDIEPAAGGGIKCIKCGGWYCY